MKYLSISIVFLSLLLNTLVAQEEITILDGTISNTDNGIIYGTHTAGSRYSYFQHIYNKDQIPYAGEITSLHFKSTGEGSFTNVKLYLSETNKTGFGSGTDWETNNLTLVYSGELTTVNGWYEVQLNEAFNYSKASNLLLVVHQDNGAASTVRHIVGGASTNSTLRNFRHIDPMGNYETNDLNPGFGSRSAVLPALKITMSSANGDNGDDNGTPTDTTQLEALTVAGFANFKGLTQFDGLVRATSGLVLENLEPELDTNDNFSMLTRGADGILRGLDRNSFLQYINTDDCFIYTNGVQSNVPTWASKPGTEATGSSGVLYTGANSCDNARVGIGTSSPLARLDVRGNAQFTREIKIGREVMIGSGFYTQNLVPEAMFHMRTQVAEINRFNNLLLIEHGGDKLLQLDKEGVLRAREVKVNRKDWSDHVFKADYELKPLSEVKAFIATNGHLPNIPSEQEVLENGIELGEMNSLLLEKVEELTLYIFELEERLAQAESDQAAVEELKERITKLEEILKLLLAKD